MPMLSLTTAERAAAIDAASSNLTFHLCEVGVPDDVQAALFHKGFNTLRLFCGLDETRLEVRKAVTTEIGLEHDADTASRKAMALILSAWESARMQVEAEDKMRVESRLEQSQRVVQISAMSAMRKEVEAVCGKLRDSEVPAKSLVAAKLEQLEQGDLQAEDLREVLCLEDEDVDLFSGIIERGTDNSRIRPGKASVPLPSCAEELRHRRRLIAVAWLMCRSTSIAMSPGSRMMWSRRSGISPISSWASTLQVVLSCYKVWPGYLHGSWCSPLSKKLARRRISLYVMAMRLLCLKVWNWHASLQSW